MVYISPAFRIRHIDGQMPKYRSEAHSHHTTRQVHFQLWCNHISISTLHCGNYTLLCERRATVPKTYSVKRNDVNRLQPKRSQSCRHSVSSSSLAIPRSRVARPDFRAARQGTGLLPSEVRRLDDIRILVRGDTRRQSRRGRVRGVT